MIMVASPSIRTFVRLSALFLMILSSYFWIRSAAIMRDNDIAILSQFRWSYDLQVANNLCHQRADALVAAGLILLSMIFQTVISYWIPRSDDGGFDKPGVIWFCVVFILTLIVAQITSERLYANQYQQVAKILTANK